MLGDCFTILPTLTAASIQTCVTHPPYWQAHSEDELGGEPTRGEYHANLVDALHGVHRVLRPEGDLWLLLDSQEAVPALVDDGWIFTHAVPYGLEWLIHFGPYNVQKFSLDDVTPEESIIAFDYYRPWPSELVSQCLDASTSRGDTVLDPFMGIGTTGRVALRKGRNFIGIELAKIMYAAAVAYIK
tara:strand:- start:116 stop:673 length:558 start_codon:yes stop_codon:yes gene_type:complete